MPMSVNRAKLYEDLSKKIGKTRLIEISDARFGIYDGNRIFAKLEYENPTGSHYDRYWLRLLYTRESANIISPRQSFPLLETSTGNSGASFAWICQQLGYKCEVIIPQDMPKARIDQIRSYGATVTFSPEKEYVRGLIDEFKGILLHRGRNYIITNHANDQTDGVSAIEELGDEILADLRQAPFNIDRIDAFISALGNGLTTRFVSKSLKKHNPDMKLLGVEPCEIPTVFKARFPERFERECKDVNINMSHELIGTGPGETNFAFPNMRAIMNEINDIYLISAIEWKKREKELSDYIKQAVGHTSSACLEAAIKYSKKVYGKNIVVIFYDPSWKYTDTFQ